MSNFLFTTAKSDFLMGMTDLLSDDVSVVLIDAELDEDSNPDLPAILLSVVGNSETLKNKTISDGVFDSDDVVFKDLPAGQHVTAILLYVNESPLAYIDSANYGLPLTTNGGPLTLSWNNGPGKIFKL